MVIVLALLLLAARAAVAATDYDVELAHIRERIAVLQRSDGGASAAERDVRRAALVFREASLTGRFDDFRRAEDAIETAFRAAGPSPDVCLLRANLDFKLHRLTRTKDDLAMLSPFADRPQVRVLAADVALAEGRYTDARRGYSEVLAETRTWDVLARLAYFASRTGAIEEAERLYAEAAEEITAKEMRSFAWIELQRGLIDFDRGRHESALRRYRRAAAAYSGYWLVDEHVAEVLDRLGRTDEAIALYRDVIRRTEGPEFMGALAGILDRTDRAAADSLYRDADRRWAEESRLYPEAALGHQIAGLLARRAPRADLLALARANHRLRPNGESAQLLARAYLRTNDETEARTIVAGVLATPWRTPDLARLASELGMATEH